MYFSCGLTLTIEYTQILDLIKKLALVLQTVAWKYDPIAARIKEGKEKASQAFFIKELSKTSSLHQPLDVFAA